MSAYSAYSIETLRYLRDSHLKQARKERELAREYGVKACIEYAREWHRDLMRRLLAKAGAP